MEENLYLKQFSLSLHLETLGTGTFIAGVTLWWTSIFGLVFFDTFIVIHTTYNTDTSTYTIYNSNKTAKVHYITDKMILYNQLLTH